MIQLKSPKFLLLLLFLGFVFPVQSQFDSTKVYKIGSDYAYYPYEFINETREPDGFDIDIINALANEMKIQIEIEAGNWFSIKKKLEEGEIDLVAGMYYLPDRAEKVNFSMPFIIITHSIFAKKGDYWQSLKDVKDNEEIKVVVENSSILHKYLTTAGISSARILPVENQLDAIKILSENPNTCALLPKLQGKYIARKHGFEEIYTVGLPILPREYSVAVKKSDTLLLNRINDAITTIHNNGIYDKIYNKWFGDFNKKESSFTNLSILEIISLLAFIIIFILFIYSNYNWKRKLKTKEMEVENESLEKENLNIKLIKNENTLRKITENTPYPISINNSKGYFLYVNRIFEDEIGYTRKEIYNLDNWLQLLFSKENERKKIEQELEQVFIEISANNKQQSTTSNIEIETKHHHTNIYRIQVIALDDGQVLFFYENITGQIEYEEKLKKAIIKAESADKLKSSFLANISHEIRTPMNAILGFSSLMAEEEIKSEDKITYYQLIKRNGNVLLMLIQDIIDFSKIETGKLNIYPQIVSVVDLMNDAYHIIKEDFSLKIPNPVQFIYTIPDDLDLNSLYIRVDPNRFSQILNNLLTNAFKYTDKGIVEFRLKILPNSKIRISVKDTGIGIRKEHHSLIFSRFGRVESKDVQIRGGTGLGLAIAYQLIKLFGSHLKIESEIDKGSHFYFDLPYYEGLAEKIDSQAIESYTTNKNYDWSGKHILVVEDNKENASYIKALLDMTNCSYNICYTGDEVKQKLNEIKKLDLVLLDWLLPDIDGEKLADLLKERFKKTPIIVVTALALIEDKMSILEKNVDDYLPKPIDRNTLLEKINQTIN